MSRGIIDNDGDYDVKQIRYHLLTVCAQAMPTYFMQVMPPHVTVPALRAAVLPRLRRSLELLAAANASPPEVVERWWERAQLPTSMGGEGVGGQLQLAGAT